MKYSLFYGTLRATPTPQYNFNRFGGQTFIRTLTIEGFDLYDSGLPRVAKGKGKLVVELHAVEDRPAAAIHQMELGAGYKEVKIPIEVVGADGTRFKDEASLYYCEGITPNKWNKLVKSGDWVKHTMSQKR